MRRIGMVPRADWQARCEEVGFDFHTLDGTYWDEGAAYEFSAAQVDQLEDVTTELHRLCVETVAWIIANQHYAPFALPPHAIAEIERSWRDADFSIYGRFDFSWDGRGEPKMLEYNADTPTALLEASVVQWFWLQDVRKDADQFNSLHEKLLARWQALPVVAGELLHFAAMTGNAEDCGTLNYLMDTAVQAGHDVVMLDIGAIGRDLHAGTFVDEGGRPLRRCYKLYPWEWLLADDFGLHVAASGTRFIEPAWKVLLSSKAILPLLWQRYPGHPNLLPASFRADINGAFVRKPVYSREGQNISLVNGHTAIRTPGEYGQEGYVFQAAAPLPCFDGRYAVIGSWIVGNEAAGIGIRDDDTPVTRNTSRFVPHFFT